MKCSCLSKKSKLVCLLFLVITLPVQVFCDKLIDSIVASVNGEPITLSELVQNYPSLRGLKIDDFKSNPNAQKLLNDLIAQKIIIHESQMQNIRAKPEETEVYFQQLAARNNMTVEQFKAALKRKNTNPKLFEQTVQTEILKTKLATKLFNTTVFVKEEEIDQYISENPQLQQSGTKIKLKQIFLSFKKQNKAKAEKTAAEVLKMYEQGVAFEKLALQFSNSPEAKRGGSLGILSEEDLDSRFFDALLTVEPGQISEAVETKNGLHIFKVEDRLSSSEDAKEDTLRTSVKEEIKQHKLKNKFAEYFMKDIYERHVVEKNV